MSVALSAADSAQRSAQGLRRPHVAEGRVLRPSSSGRPVPVAGQWVVLHRVGSDRAGPLDSTRSDANGRFRFRYSPSGAQDALYFVSSKFGGIAYFSPPLRAPTVRGGDADVMVYETTTDSATLRVQGRHFVLSGLRGARREIAEIFEIENQGTQTVVARDSTAPLWTTQLPAAAESATVAPGDVAAGAVVIRRGRAEVFAPISPGVRQLVLTYLLPTDAFPVSVPVGRMVSVFEVLLEDPRATVEGARLNEVAPVTIDGRTFRRFLATDVPALGVMRVNAPPPVGQNQTTMRVLVIVLALAMIGAVAVWALHRRPALASHVRASTSDADRLIAEVASLDLRFERDQAPSGEARASYEQRRAELKTRIARALAEEKRPT